MSTAKLQPLPKGYRRTYSQVFDPEGKVCLSKWHTTQSCADAYARQEQDKVVRFAALAEKSKAIRAGKAAMRNGEGTARFMCFTCRRVHVTGARQLCEKCANKADLVRRRKLYADSKGLDSPFFENSPLRAEALTHEET